VAHLKPSDGGTAATQRKYSLLTSLQPIESAAILLLPNVVNVRYGQLMLMDDFLQWLLILQEYTVPSRCLIAGSVLSISILLPCKKVCIQMLGTLSFFVTYAITF
jgi:hypothetical protein